jgi:hypothetical protein
MKDQKDPLKQFLEFRERLVAEREQLTARLREINGVVPIASVNGGGVFSGQKRTRITRNPLSLKAAILKITEKKALTKHEILDAVLALGYKFTTNDPLNSIGVIIYGKDPKFVNEGGRFRVR